MESSRRMRVKVKESKLNTCGVARIGCRYDLMRVLALMMVASAVGAQPSRQVTHVAACSRCSIKVERILTLGSDSDPIGVAPGMPVVQNSKGQYVAVGDDFVSFVLYSPAGKLTAKIGRKGEGPAEFIRIEKLRVGKGDSILVTDIRQRLSVFSPEGRFVRSIRLPASAAGGVILDDGRVVVAKQIRTAERMGFSYHLLDRDGTIIRSFGPEEPSAPGMPAVSLSLTQSLNGTQLWSLSRDFRLRSWGLGGEQLSDFTIVAHPWGTPPPLVVPNVTSKDPAERGRQLAAALKGPPGRTRVNLAGIDHRGFLWLNVLVPDKNHVSDSTEAHFLEVIDPIKGELIFSQRVPMWNLRLMPSLDGLLGYAAAESADGFLRVEIWKLELVGR
jgi:hypothetical protein